VFLPNYSSGNVKTNSIRPVSVCLAFFKAIWHFLRAVWHFLFTWTWQPCCCLPVDKELGLPDGRYFTGLAGILLLI